MKDRDLSALEDQISRILRLGVGGSTAVLALGLALWLTGGPSTGLLKAGLILLMTIPIARILASFLNSIRRRDRLLSWSTAAVLVILSVTIAYSLLVN